VNDSAQTPIHSQRWFAVFGWYLRRYFVRHFDGVRVAPPGPPDLAASPTVFYANHPSWWDPILFMLLAHSSYPSRRHFGPMDEDALSGYGFFRRLGVFAVEQGTARGARQFLRGSSAALSTPDGTLWLTPQGRFCDSRSRENLQPGLAHLVNIGDCQFVPMAIEYVFWNQRLPEVLVEFGAPRLASTMPDRASERLTVLREELESTQASLAARALARDPAGFETILCGATGVGGTYDRWRRLKALLLGRRFTAAHRVTETESATDDTVRPS